MILTIVKDKIGNNIVVPIEIETKTDINKISMEINRIKSVYGYDRKKPDLNKYIKDNLNSKTMIKIYEQKKQSTNITSQSTFDTKSISHFNTNVKQDLSSSIQYNQNTSATKTLPPPKEIE